MRKFGQRLSEQELPSAGMLQ